MMVTCALDGDRDPIPRLSRERGDAPVGPGVAGDGGDTRGAVVELDAGLDPLGGRGRGRVALFAQGEK